MAAVRNRSARIRAPSFLPVEQLHTCSAIGLRRMLLCVRPKTLLREHMTAYYGAKSYVTSLTRAAAAELAESRSNVFHLPERIRYTASGMSTMLIMLAAISQKSFT